MRHLECCGHRAAGALVHAPGNRGVAAGNRFHALDVARRVQFGAADRTRHEQTEHARGVHRVQHVGRQFARRVFGARAVGTEFDALLFLVGAGFLLIETRGVTTLSLLFGSTWMVNAAVFAGILLVALVANLYVTRFGAPPLDICFVLLFASVAVLWVVDNSVLNRFDLPLRGVFGGVVNALPVGFAGVIVSTLLARSPNPTASLASNLLGSVVGGCLEYLSMVIGLRALALLALAIYLGAFFVLRRRGVTASVAWSAETAS